jgi:hypothetical protein
MQIWARIRGKCGPVKSDLSFKMSRKICLVTQSPFWLCCLVPRASIFGEPWRFQAWVTSQTFLDILFLCSNIIIKFAICEHWGLRTSYLPTYRITLSFYKLFCKLIFRPLPTTLYKSICIRVSFSFSFSIL